MEVAEGKKIEYGFYLEVHDSALFVLQRIESLQRGLVVPYPQKDWFTEAVNDLRKENERVQALIERIRSWADKAHELSVSYLSHAEETALRTLTEDAYTLNHRNRNEYFSFPEQVCKYAKIPELRLDYSLIDRELQNMRKHFQDYL